MRFQACVLLIASLAAGPAGAVLLSTGDGTGNTTAPADDPGFLNVGAAGSLTAVYLGDGWVITANHVSNSSPVFGGVSYAGVAGSSVQLHNTDGSLADVRIFRVNPFPPLPSLTIQTSAPAIGSNVVMIGRGRDRGAATSWGGYSGWLYAATGTLRWGTNRVAARNLDVLGTRAFETNFSQSGGTTSEAQAATGDSGGAVFLKSGGTWGLAGILFAVGTYDGQPNATALFGNLTYAAQLSDYADEISGYLSLPVCGDGLDNDADGLADWPADPGCVSDSYGTENPACNNQIDDDGDGMVDLADPECSLGPWYTAETPAQACGLGYELALLLPALAWLRGRGGQRAARSR